MYNDKKYKDAIPHLQKAADGDNPAAQRTLGQAYENGLGVTRNLDKARSLYQRASAQGDSDAKAALARLGQPALSPPGA